MRKIHTKIFGSLVALSLLSAVSCNKNTTEKEGTATEKSTEISLEQEAKILKNEKGESVTIVYYAAGDEVAVKLTKNGQEHQLKAKGSNNKGEPIFTDGTFAWEMMDSGFSGRLTDKTGNMEVYKPESEQQK